MTKLKSNHLAILMLIIGLIISGINTPIIHYALNTVPVPLFGFLRLVIPLVIITPIMLLKKRAKLKPQQILLAMLFGVLIYFASNGLFYLGIKLSGSINAAIIGLLEPILMFAFSVEVMREQFSPRILIGIIIALGGSILVVFGPILAHQSFTFGGSLVGNLLLVGCALCSVSGTWVAKIGLRKMDRVQMLFWSIVAGTIIFGYMSFRQWSQIPVIIQDPSVLYAVLYGAIFNGLIAYLLFFYAIKRMRGEEFGLFGYISPAVAAVVAVIFFGESFTPSLLLGVVIIIAGLYLAEIKHHKVDWSHIHISRGR